ncbi:amidohydrolase [Kiloniella spongiae]|uniref:Amidohydrolase n=1 Tax=Kiloniella spongiae TaxID=1489064 RepID=A0A0H2MEX1_9PROT|nr:amidohydrolase [Kiloniella spongiae]KLN60776.1 amidohydrolase [Kiloniella spongiae]
MANVTPDAFQHQKQKLIDIRHDLHRNPELGFEEHRTAQKVASELKSYGLEVHEGIGGTGVVGILKKGGGNQAIALRADMDALPIEETSSHQYCSTVSGKMHACGHDGHTAMLLGAAQFLSEKQNFNGTVVFIFQPNEENGLGAAAMVNDELLEKFPVDEIYGLHNLPGAPLGEFSTRVGTICSSESLFEITIKARGGHSAMPQKGVDAILVGSEIVQAFQSIVARKMDPGCGAVVSITEFTTDGRRNVLPGSATLKGDVRARTPDDREQIKTHMQRLLNGITHGHDVEADFSFNTEFIETINSADPTQIAIQAAKKISDNVEGDREPMSFSEDFALFSQKKPGCFILMGNGTEGAHGKPLHASDYDFNDDALTIGAAFWAQLVANRLPE